MINGTMVFAILIAFHVASGMTVDNSNKGFKIGVISDLNQEYGNPTYTGDAHKAVTYLVDPKNQIELVLSTGDMVAGQQAGHDYQAMWNGFHGAVTDKFQKAQIPFAPSPGNHDASTGKRFRVERELYVSTFQQRSPSVLLNGEGELRERDIQLVDDSNFPLYYGFTYKNVLFLAIDATDPYRLSNRQMEWIKRSLESHPEVVGRVIFGHVPLLPFADTKVTEHLSRPDPRFEKRFQDILDAHQVDLFLSGHHHLYYSGHRNKKTRFISTPLLGGGPRRWLGWPKLGRSPHGFLEISFMPGKGFSVNAIATENMRSIPMSRIPVNINVPEEDDEKFCRKGCKDFPSSLFLDSKDRILFLRNEN